MSHCPSCGRYVGPHDACPYCGARMAGRMPIRVVKLTAIVLATVGLAILWFVATRVEVPTVAMGRAGATMNLAYVRVEGLCIRAPSYDPETEYLSFWLADGTGEMRVVSYRAETRSLIKQQRLPALGDQVAVAGTLRIRDDYRSLTIDAPEQLSIFRSRPVTCPIGAISEADVFQRVRVRGEVRDVVQPYQGLTLIALRDETGTIDVAVSDDQIALGDAPLTLVTGRSVEVVAAVSLYDSHPQLVPASAEDVIPLDQDVPLGDSRSVIELHPGDVGQWIIVRGRIARLDPFSEGLKLSLDDGTGIVTVLLWDDVYEALVDESGASVRLSPGAEIEVQGELAEYRGELEVIPELAVDVRVVASAPLRRATSEPTEPATSITTAVPVSSPSPTPVTVVSSTSTPTALPTVDTTATPRMALTSIESIDSNDVGDELTVEGVVVDADSFSRGFKLTLDDDGAQIVLLMWHDVYDECSDRSLINVGSTVRVTGEVSQYEEQLQIEPHIGGDVRVSQAADVQAPRQEIRSVSDADEGQRVMIEGVVARTEGLPSAVKVFLRADEPTARDEIPVFVWRNVLDRVVDNVGLGTPGSRVRVVGTVQVYRSSLEIVPALPNDVTVLEIP